MTTFAYLLRENRPLRTTATGRTVAVARRGLKRLCGLALPHLLDMPQQRLQMRGG